MKEKQGKGGKVHGNRKYRNSTSLLFVKFVILKESSPVDPLSEESENTGPGGGYEVRGGRKSKKSDLGKGRTTRNDWFRLGRWGEERGRNFLLCPHWGRRRGFTRRTCFLRGLLIREVSRKGN